MFIEMITRPAKATRPQDFGTALTAGRRLATWLRLSFLFSVLPNSLL
jgi:hypothetical protein